MIANILLYKDTIFLIPLLGSIYILWIFYDKLQEKNTTLYKILDLGKHIIFAAQIYMLLFATIVFFLHSISPEYRAGTTSGPGMGSAFGHGIILAIFIYFILPLSFVCNVIIKFIQSKIEK